MCQPRCRLSALDPLQWLWPPTPTRWQRLRRTKGTFAGEEIGLRLHLLRLHPRLRAASQGQQRVQGHRDKPNPALSS